LAARNQTAEELENAVWAMLDTLKYNPVPVGNVLVDYASAKGILTQAMYGPGGWPKVAVTLDAFLTAIAIGGPQPGPDSPEQFDLALLKKTAQTLYSIAGIHCGDRKTRLSTLEQFMPAVDKLYQTSRLFGDVTVGLAMQCAKWKMEPKERYEGNFHAKTKGPMLILGNTLDGHTPLKSAHNVSAGFEGSVVLEINGYGVSSENPFFPFFFSLPSPPC
jgi:hypothetical protein